MAIALLMWSAVPALIFAREGRGAPAEAIGFDSVFTGQDLTADQRRELSLVLPSVYLNESIPGAGVGAGSRVLLVGDATPFYYRRNVSYQTTWDRGPLSRAMDVSPNDPAAWMNALRRDGFTHILLSPTMLRVWEQARWNDPRITVERVTEAFDQHARLMRTFETGARLYALP